MVVPAAERRVRKESSPASSAPLIVISNSITPFAQIFQLSYVWRMKALLASIVLFAGLLVAPLSHAGEPRTALVMFEQQNCEWCAAWFSEIGPIYPLTAEGKRAPIRRVDIHDPMPDDLAHIEGSRFTLPSC